MTWICPQCGCVYFELTADKRCDWCPGQLLEEEVFDQSEDDRLDDPRHGQAAGINKIIR